MGCHVNVTKLQHSRMYLHLKQMGENHLNFISLNFTRYNLVAQVHFEIGMFTQKNKLLNLVDHSLLLLRLRWATS